MMDSRFNSIAVPQVGIGNFINDETPSPIAQSQKTPLRVLVRNASNAGSLFLAYDAAVLADSVQPAGSVYELPPGYADAFVLAPGQKLYAASASANGRASMAISEALPLDKQV